MITFQVAYAWLYQFEDVDSNLSPSAKSLQRDIQETLASNDYSEIEKFINQIVKLARISPKYLEAAEIYLVCARAYFVMGEMEKSLQLLDRAGKLYKSDLHKYAVTQWMKGCVLWELEGEQVEALQLWQRSLDTFETLQKQYLINKQGAQWYKQQCERMRQVIKEANPQKAVDPRIHQSLYPVLQQILLQDTQIPTTPRKVNSNQFWIDRRLYQLINLDNKSALDLVDASNLFALWVEDDTMDKIGIMKGDYVLVRWQDTANHNSIVLVLIANEDTHAKLKSYSEEGGKIILRPQSKNPDNLVREFTGVNQGFQIKGVVLGVFKPV